MESTYKNPQKTLNTDYGEKIDYDLVFQKERFLVIVTVLQNIILIISMLSVSHLDFGLASKDTFLRCLKRGCQTNEVRIETEPISSENSLTDAFTMKNIRLLPATSV